MIEWEARSDGVTVRTARAEYRAERLIMCGGAWSSRLLSGLGVKLRVTRQVLGWVWPPRPDAFLLARFPVWAIEKPDGSLYYGFPIIPGSEAAGLKVAWHGRGRKPTPTASSAKSSLVTNGVSARRWRNISPMPTGRCWRCGLVFTPTAPTITSSSTATRSTRT